MRRVLVSVLVASLALVGCTDEDPVIPEPPDSETASATDSPSPDATDGATDEPTEEPEGTPDPVALRADLSGVTQVPGPGDPTGTGTFTGTVEMAENSGELCYELRVSDLTSPVVAAHIHTGAAGTAGGVLVALEAPLEGSSEGCVTINAADVVDLLDDPSAYYVNVHSSEHPDGAVRGQLAPA